MTVEQWSVGARARVHAALGEPARLAIVDELTFGDASPGELGRALDMPTNLLAHHLKVLEEAAVITRVRSEGDRRRTYVRLVPETFARLDPHLLAAAERVVFVCTHNSARSQLAAALWARRSAVPAASAGTRPAPRVHPRAIRVARRHDLDLGRSGTAHVADVVTKDDLVVAVCDDAHEQLLESGRHRLHWSVPDPAAADTDEAFEAAFAEIAARIDRLAPALTPRSPS
jgi:protein-tyrosine-phosphatase/DNA-binding HxlR family transcriptional regulator